MPRGSGPASLVNDNQRMRMIKRIQGKARASECKRKDTVDLRCFGDRVWTLNAFIRFAGGGQKGCVKCFLLRCSALRDLERLPKRPAGRPTYTCNEGWEAKK